MATGYMSKEDRDMKKILLIALALMMVSGTVWGWEEKPYAHIIGKQIANLTAGNPVELETVTANYGITVNSTNYRVSLLPGHTYKLSGSATAAFSGTGGYVAFDWYNVSRKKYYSAFGQAANGDGQVCFNIQFTGAQASDQPIATAIVSGLTETSQFDLRINAQSLLTVLYQWAEIEMIK
jgi:hypothetical protein